MDSRGLTDRVRATIDRVFGRKGADAKLAGRLSTEKTVAVGDEDRDAQGSLDPELANTLNNYVHTIGEQEPEFKGHQLEEIDHKLAHLAGIWHNLDAWNELVRRHGGDANWVESFLYRKYGDLIYQK